jgi:hypothetical protein
MLEISQVPSSLNNHRHHTDNITASKMYEQGQLHPLAKYQYTRKTNNTATPDIYGKMGIVAFIFKK